MANNALTMFSNKLKELNNKPLRTKKELIDNAKLLAICFYNCGAEQEYLKQLNRSIFSFKKSYKIACDYLGKNDYLTKRSLKAY
jgi:hypothetical protein